MIIQSPTSSRKITKTRIKILGCEAIRNPKGSENDRNYEPKLKEYSIRTSEVTPTMPNSQALKTKRDYMHRKSRKEGKLSIDQGKMEGQPNL